MERYAYQRSIEEVYWRHRIWPKDRPDPKPSLDEMMSPAQIEQKVEDYLRDSQALAEYWKQPISATQLQTEMERMARDTTQPGVLRELFAVLGNDPLVIAECLARPALTERLVANFTREQGFSDELIQRSVNQMRGAPLESPEARAGGKMVKLAATSAPEYVIPTITEPVNGFSEAVVPAITGANAPMTPAGVCTDGSWTATSLTNAPASRFFHSAVWTGSEMIIWGGVGSSSSLLYNSGARYNPATDSWVATSLTDAPVRRKFYTAVWTGNEMIIWGGETDDLNHTRLNTGAKYNPGSNSWTATSLTNAPEGRVFHSAVWTGSEMIIWGSGLGGGRYNPGTDSWTATSLTNEPEGRSEHTAVWTGNEMIIWGGRGNATNLNTGGVYNPGTDSWNPTNLTNAPEGRYRQTAVWTGSEMIVWGGIRSGSGTNTSINTGGRYNPATGTWTATSLTDAPARRTAHTTVWTGNEMIIFGGGTNSGSGAGLDTGAKYNPGSNSWTPTSLTNAPDERYGHTAVWTGTEMIVWGGNNFGTHETGGRLCVQTTPPSPTTLGNIATRLRVETGNNILIGGFIVTGTQPKNVIVRAIGPSLSSFFPDALVDPILELRDSSGGLIRSNDNWRSDQETEIAATGIAPSNNLESAIVATLPANNSAYTAIVRGVNDGTGIGVVEAYDLDQTVDSKLANISTRGLVQTGNNVLIAGTIVLGQTPQRVLVRAIGPSLPVEGKLANPTLELRDGNGALIRANDNWRSDQEAEIIATTIPPSDDMESALIETLPANGAAYTAIVRGVGDTTGVAVVEVYGLN